MSWRSDAQIGASAAGTGAGLLAGLIPGVGAAGPLFGAGLGEGLAAIFGLGEKPSFPGVPPEMLQSQGLQMFGLSQIASMQGLSSRDVSRIGQLGQEDINAEILRANTMSQRMTPYDRKRLYDRLIEMARGSRQALTDKVSMLDVGAAAQNAQTLVTGGAQAANTAANIQNIQFRNQIMYDDYRSKNLQAFSNGMAGALKSIFAGSEMMRADAEAAKKEAAASAAEKDVMDAKAAAANEYMAGQANRSVSTPDAGADDATKRNLIELEIESLLKGQGSGSGLPAMNYLNLRIG